MSWFIDTATLAMENATTAGFTTAATNRNESAHHAMQNIRRSVKTRIVLNDLQNLGFHVHMTPQAIQNTTHNEEAQLFNMMLKMIQDANLSGTHYNALVMTLIVLLFFVAIIMYLAKHRRRLFSRSKDEAQRNASNL